MTEMRAEISPSNPRDPDVALRLTRFIGVRFCYTQMRRKDAKKSMELAGATVRGVLRRQEEPDKCKQDQWIR
jgi:hypothetical protein